MTRPPGMVAFFAALASFFAGAGLVVAVALAPPDAAARRPLADGAFLAFVAVIGLVALQQYQTRPRP